MIGSEPMTVDAAVTHCANPKCRCGRPKGVPALVDQQGIAAAADRLWPVTTLANGRKVLKFCDVRCCHEYQDAQTKLPEEQRDPDVGTILCSRCGNEVRGLNMGVQGGRDKFCSVECVSPLALAYRARDRTAAETANHSLHARRRGLPAPEDPVDMVAAYNQRHHEVLVGGSKGVLWDVLMPGLDTVYEWRIELDCGCVRQEFTGGEDSGRPERLLSGCDEYLIGHGLRLPAGQRRCACRGLIYPNGPVREILEWVDRDRDVKTLEPLVGGGKKVTDGHRYVSWYVVLDCGHVATVTTDPDWKPADGFLPRGVMRDRREMEKTFREVHADDEHYLAYVLRQLDENFPSPAPFTNCDACHYSRYIVAYHSVGLVAPPPPPPRKPRKQKSRQQMLQERIKRSERELRQLRAELKELPPQDV
jgi:hypothetical protein